MTSRRVGAWVVVVLGAAFVALVAWLVPWDPVGGGPLQLPAASEVLGPEQVARAEEFSSGARLWSWTSLALSLLVTVLLGFTRWGPALVARLHGPWWLVAAQAVVVVLLIGRIATLPLAAAQHSHYVEAGLATQSWGLWLVDVAKAELLQVVVTTLVVWVILGTARRWECWWPVIAGGLLAAGVVAGSFAYPLVVEPAFNRFQPLPEGELRGQVVEVAAQQGVRVDQVLVADASRRTTTLNAYVSGLWGSRRVVLYDTLVADLPPDRVLAVVAHEVAHARHDDVLLGTSLGAVGTAWAVGLLAVVAGRRRPDRPEVVPRLLALTALAGLLAGPVQSVVSRHIETRADVAALQATGDRAAFEQMQVQLAVRSLADPTPPAWSQWAFGSHPTVLERIAVARRVLD